MVKLAILGALLCLLAGCGSGMPEAYSVLPNTFDDLAQKTKAFRGEKDTNKPASQQTKTSG